MTKGRMALAAALMGVSASAWGANAPVNVPELMKSFSGNAIKSVADWESVRNPEILEAYRTEVFGVRPKAADERKRVSFEVFDVA